MGGQFINGVVKVGEIITQPITDKWFYWAMLTFILHHKDWKYANFNIAIIMWIVHSIALVYPKFVNIKYDQLEGPSKWKIADVPPFIFFFLSEIVGDWYIAFIIKQIGTRNKFYIASAFCLISNCIKLIISYTLYNGNDQCDGKLPPFNCFTDSALWQKYQKLECANIVGVAVYYGVCYYLLLTCKSEKDEENTNIVKHFRRDSRIRMMFSCLCALVSCAFGIPFIIDTFTRNFEFRLEVTREAIMSLTYYMIYIDQILKSEQTGGQAFRSTSNDQSTSGNYSGSTKGFSSKGVLDNNKVHHTNDFGATPWNSNSNMSMNY